MIYSYNVIGWYTNKDNRQYDNTGNERILHHFETNKIPSFQIVLVENVTTFQYQLYDIDDNLIYSGNAATQQSTNNYGIGYSRLKLNEVSLSGNDDGFYYLKINYNSKSIFSDVFCWQTDLSDYLKVVATSSDIQIGEFIYDMGGFTYKVYLDAKSPNIEYEIEEEGIEKTYGNIPLFNSRNKISQFHITGYKTTFDFLAGLRILWTNGNVTLEYNGDEFEIYDMENPEVLDSYSYSDIIVMSLKFKRKDYLQSINDL